MKFVLFIYYNLVLFMHNDMISPTRLPYTQDIVHSHKRHQTWELKVVQ